MWIFIWILLLIVGGLLFYFIIRTTKTKVQMPKQRGSPLDILKKRHARGKITKEEFDKIKRIWRVEKE
ncbi:MAG TPA: SHOCT domain-containing protein [Syntrophales bacterium]|nr:SHOCT domain-containing protein [Syntrophales bacterium]